MATTTQLIQLVTHIKYANAGWSEKFFLPETTFASAAINAKKLTLWRARAMAPGGEMVWARISFVDTPRNTIACLNGPILARAYAGVQANPIEDPHTCLHFRMETADGNWGNRLVRGIADEVVNQNQAQPNVNPTWIPYAPDAALPDIDDLATLHSNIVLGFLEFARRHTVHAKLLPGPTVAWETTEWAKVIFRKVANRKTGMAFGQTRGRARKRVAAPTPS